MGRGHVGGGLRLSSGESQGIKDCGGSRHEPQHFLPMRELLKAIRRPTDRRMAPSCYVTVDPSLPSRLDDNYCHSLLCPLLPLSMQQPEGFAESRADQVATCSSTSVAPYWPLPNSQALGFRPRLASLPLHATAHLSYWLQLWGPPSLSRVQVPSCLRDFTFAVPTAWTAFHAHKVLPAIQVSA